jgi:hypothetical protein
MKHSQKNKCTHMKKKKQIQRKKVGKNAQVASLNLIENT